MDKRVKGVYEVRCRNGSEGALPIFYVIVAKAMNRINMRNWFASGE